MTVKNSNGRLAFSRNTNPAPDTLSSGEINLDLEKGVSGLTLTSLSGEPVQQKHKLIEKFTIVTVDKTVDISKGRYFITATEDTYGSDGSSSTSEVETIGTYGLLPFTTPTKTIAMAGETITINMGDDRDVDFNAYASESLLYTMMSNFKTMDISSDGLWIVFVTPKYHGGAKWGVVFDIFHRTDKNSNWSNVKRITYGPASVYGYDFPQGILPVVILDGLDFGEGEGASEDWMVVSATILLRSSTGVNYPASVYFSLNKTTGTYYNPRISSIDISGGSDYSNFYFQMHVNGKSVRAEVDMSAGTYRSITFSPSIINGYPYNAGSPTYSVGNVDAYGTITIKGNSSPIGLDISRCGSITAVSNGEEEIVVTLDEDTETLSTLHLNNLEEYQSGRYLELSGLYIDGQRVAGIEVYDPKGNVTSISSISKYFFASPNGYCSGFAVVIHSGTRYHSYFYLTDAGVLKFIILGNAIGDNDKFYFKGSLDDPTKSIKGVLAAINWSDNLIKTYTFN